ncbi:T9SS type A sorting domain-containing protein, partial [Bacteroidota bacterium]
QLRGNNLQSNNSFGIIMPSHEQTLKAKNYIKNSKNNLDGYQISKAQMLANEASEDSALIYLWDTDWELSYRIYYYLDATSLEILQEKLNPDDTWSNYYKQVLEYYSTGTFRRETDSFWKNSSSDWKIAYFEEFNTYERNTEVYSRTWNDTIQEFTEGFRIIYSYTKDTLLKSEIYQEWDTISKGWMNMIRIDNDYSANDLISNSLESVWKEGNWGNSYSIEYDYNEFGDLETRTDRDWDTVSLAWINDFKTERQYNSIGSITTVVLKEWDTDASDWVNEFQQVLNYDEYFQVESVLSQTWNGNLWIDSLRTSYTYTAEGRTSQYLEEMWDVSDWIGVYREDYTYDSTEITIEIDDWNTTSKTWENQTLIIYFIDELGYLMVEQWEYWNSLSSAYEIGYYDEYDDDGTNPESFSKTWNDTLNEFTGGIRILTTYYDDANRSLLQRIIQEWDTDASDWLNFQKTNYFWSSNVSVESIILSGSYNIFPSPFSSIINVERDDDPESISVLKIFDLTGKLVHQTELTDRKTTLDLSFLESGVYLAEIGALKSRTVIKLVKY